MEHGLVVWRVFRGFLESSDFHQEVATSRLQNVEATLGAIRQQVQRGAELRRAQMSWRQRLARFLVLVARAEERRGCLSYGPHSTERVMATIKEKERWVSEK